MKISSNHQRIFEIGAVTAVVWLLSVVVVSSTDGPGLSWDAINHHIYLGWFANSPRFNQDFWAAASQSYQFPYLFWPVYKLIQAGVSSTAVGIVLASLQVTAVPALCLIAERCIPERSLFGFAMRLLAVGLALCSAVIISLIGGTANDLLASVPLLWSVAFAVNATATRNSVFISGFLAGVSVAFKLSNAPLVLMLPILWFTGHAREDINTLFGAIFAAFFGYVLVYGYWGWKLFSQFGNPFYPNDVNILRILGL